MTKAKVKPSLGLSAIVGSVLLRAVKKSVESAMIEVGGTNWGFRLENKLKKTKVSFKTRVDTPHAGKLYATLTLGPKPDNSREPEEYKTKGTDYSIYMIEVPPKVRPRDLYRP